MLPVVFGQQCFEPWADVASVDSKEEEEDIS
jgi:hypothetical protein